MRKVIDGKVYNTDTAEDIASRSNGHYVGDFNYSQETIYKTQKGRYFLHGEGGALSEWSVTCGNGWSGGEDIQTMTEADVIRWLQENNKLDALETLFPDSIEEA